MHGSQVTEFDRPVPGPRARGWRALAQTPRQLAGCGQGDSAANRPLLHWTIIVTAVLLWACSGPPNFRPPDRRPSLDGVIVSVEASAESIDIVELGVQLPGRDQPVRAVMVAHETLILTPNNVYPQTVAMLQRGRFVRVWLQAASASDPVLPVAEVIEVAAPPGT